MEEQPSLIVSIQGLSAEATQEELTKELPLDAGLQFQFQEPPKGVRSGTALDLAVFLENPELLVAATGAITMLVGAVGTVIGSGVALAALIINTRLKRMELSLREREVKLKEEEAAGKDLPPAFTVQILEDALQANPAECSVIVRTDRKTYTLKKGSEPSKVREFLEDVYFSQEPIRMINFPTT